MDVHCIDYRKLPGQNPLFLSYLYEPEQVTSFYHSFPFSLEQVKARAKSVATARRFPGSELVDSLRKFNREIGAEGAVESNIELLGDPESVAVVTGQQVGLFGGPAYAVYKAATALRITELLRAEGIKAVPVFWLAADDSDFQEVRSTFFLDQKDRVFEVRHPDTRAKEEQMAGTVHLSQISQALDLFQSRRGDSQFAGFVDELLTSSYGPGRSFRHSFGAWMGGLFQGTGLVFFDPLTGDHAKHLEDFYSVVIEERDALVAALKERGRALEDAGFSPQVWVDEAESLLFWIEGKNRYKLEYENGEYRAKQKRSIRLSSGDLLKKLKDGSARLGPNVLLRPILQDYLLPAALYVGGPAEVAYFSQLTSISRFWELEMAILPRAAFTVIDSETGGLLQDYGLRPEQVLASSKLALTETVLRNLEVPSQTLQRFDDLKESLSGQIDELESALRAEDPTVADMLKNARKKIDYQVDKVSRRYISNQQERNGALGSRLASLHNRLLPGDQLQERKLNFNQVLLQAGPDFLPRLLQELYPFCLSHRLLYL